MNSQMDMINKYCGDIAERIRACRSIHIASVLKERLCSELEPNCQSEIVRQVLRRHIDQLINSTFDDKGRNIYLEESE